MSKEIATTILNQLGGNKFIAMTGAKNFMSDGNKIHFKIGRNAARVNYVTVELTGMDDYIMTFKYVTIKTIKEIAVKSGIYCDQLKAMFTEVTGMYTHL